MNKADLINDVKIYMKADKYKTTLTGRLGIAMYQIAQGFEWGKIENDSVYESFTSAIVHYIYAAEMIGVWLEEHIDLSTDYKPLLVTYKAWFYHSAKCFQYATYYKPGTSRSSRFNKDKMAGHLESCIYYCIVHVPRDKRDIAFENSFKILYRL